MLLVSFESKDNYLLVTGHGRRDNLAQMVETAAEIYRKVEETNAKRLLVDYRALEINVLLGDAYNIVRRYETSTPGLRDIRIAAVFDKKGMEFGSYWKEVAQKRGFTIETFIDIVEAERWLLDDKS